MVVFYFKFIAISFKSFLVFSYYILYHHWKKFVFSYTYIIYLNLVQIKNKIIYFKNKNKIN